MVISLVKFQTTNTYVAAKNKIIIRYMYIYEVEEVFPCT